MPRHRENLSRLALSSLILPVVVAALSFPRAAQAQVQGYRLDPVHTRIMFAIDHAGYSAALGTVSGSTGSIAFDPDDWRNARVDVQVPLQRIDLGDEPWNRAARRILDVERHPLARFVSDSVEPIDATHAAVCGTLVLHGQSRPLCLQATFNQLKRQSLPPFRRTVGFSATGLLFRGDYGIDDWQSLVGDVVELRIEVEAHRDNDVL
ncbi:MAG: YceI family protein [Pseudomonadota bacterium]|nr:YceI family protein [Pseudomonadota bacterium]